MPMEVAMHTAHPCASYGVEGLLCNTKQIVLEEVAHPLTSSMDTFFGFWLLCAVCDWLSKLVKFGHAPLFFSFFSLWFCQEIVMPQFNVRIIFFHKAGEARTAASYFAFTRRKAKKGWGWKVEPYKILKLPVPRISILLFPLKKNLTVSGKINFW